MNRENADDGNHTFTTWSKKKGDGCSCVNAEFERL